MLVLTRFHAARRLTAVNFLVLCGLLFPNSSAAGLFQPENSPLRQFGFDTGSMQSPTEFKQYFEVTGRVLGAGAIVRTGLGWDPTKNDVPGFVNWSANVLEPARAKGITILPGIRTLNLDSGGYRMPTDGQWAHGLRQIVRMYGPGGVYAKGGSYVHNGRTVSVPAHPGFEGLTDFELWSEPNTQGNLGGAMTPTRVTQLLRIGAAVMRDEAARLGFRINIVGPGVGGTDLEYVKQLWQADYQVFRSINTLSVHAYLRVPLNKCDAYGTSRLHCIKTLILIREFLDSHGGAHVHLATTEGGYAGSLGTCLGPQVHTEALQSAYSEEALRWLRANPNLDFDFWITFRAIDGTATYSYACDSGKYDIRFWSQKLGVMRANLTLKAWGIRYRELVNLWR